MSGDIKRGDLVMVVKAAPCCGASDSVGRVFTVADIVDEVGECNECGLVSASKLAVISYAERKAQDVYRLTKIDPPATGDSLPTRADIGVHA